MAWRTAQAAQAALGPPDSTSSAPHCNVYVTGFPDGVNELSFRQLFEGFGSIASCKLMQDKKYGFVKFGEVHEAQNAIDSLNGFEYKGAQLIVRFANNGPRGDEAQLPVPAAPQPDAAPPLWNHRGKEGGASGWANHEANAWWKEEQWGEVDASGGQRHAQQDWGESRSHQRSSASNGWGWRSQKGAQPEEPSASDCLLVRGLPANMTERWLLDIFKSFGHVVSAQVIDGNSAAADGTWESVAWVRMASQQDATLVVKHLNGRIPPGLHREVLVRFADAQQGGKKGGGKQAREEAWAAPSGKGQGKAEASGQGYRQSAAPANAGWGEDPYAKGGKQQRPSDRSNLYIKDLPQHADDLYLYRVFAPYGAISSVKAILGSDGHCLGFGFVKYLQDDDADRAIEEINGVQLHDGSVLQVSIKTEKQGKHR